MVSFSCILLSVCVCVSIGSSEDEGSKDANQVVFVEHRPESSESHQRKLQVLKEASDMIRTGGESLEEKKRRLRTLIK